jgi:hypothetical protein
VSALPTAPPTHAVVLPGLTVQGWLVVGVTVGSLAAVGVGLLLVVAWRAVRRVGRRH